MKLRISTPQHGNDGHINKLIPFNIKKGGAQ